MGRVPDFVAEQWLKADGDGRKAGDASLRAGVRCDALGCVTELADTRAVALVRDRRAFAENCRRAAFVITRLAAPPTCRPPVLLDRTFFAAHGATAIRLTAAGHHIVTTRHPSEARPWQRAGPNQANRPPSASRIGNRPAAQPAPDEETVEPPLDFQ